MTSSSQNLSFEKGRDGNDRRASWMGNGRLGWTTRRNEGVPMRNTFATRARRATFVGRTTVVQNLRQPAAQISAAPGSEKEVAQKFSRLVANYSRNDLAEISERTPEAAQHWLDGTRAPNTATLFKMSRKSAAIQEWAASELGIEIQRQSGNSAAAMAALQLIAALPGEAGAMARASLRAIQSGGN